MPQAVTRATQGHRYTWRGLNVLAMESGDTRVRVRVIQPTPAGFDWFGPIRRAHVSELVACPMAYFKGETPQ